MFVLPNSKNIAFFYESLDVNEIITFIDGEDKIIIKKLAAIKGRRDSCLALLSNLDNIAHESILDEYLIRWKIERAFFNIESNGWQLSRTHLQVAKRVEMMFYILSLCYYFSVVFGYICVRLKKAKKKSHGYMAVSLFLNGRRFIDELFTRYKLVSFVNIVKLLYDLIVKLSSDVEILAFAEGVV